MASFWAVVLGQAASLADVGGTSEYPAWKVSL